MKTKLLGRTGIAVSRVAFGAGPVSGWVAEPDAAQQRRVIEQALEVGINWFDTAATYGEGRSELALGRCLQELGATESVHVATKVRLNETAWSDVRGFIQRSVRDSLQRLRMNSVTLLQLHNSVTPQRDDQPTSITPDDVLGAGGVLETFLDLQSQGVVRHLGITGLGDPEALRQVLASREFETVQMPYNLLNSSAGQAVLPGTVEADYGNLFATCLQQQVGVFAIRVFAGGALANREPSAHTRVTKFFPLDLYERDRQRALELAQTLPPGETLPNTALRFALAHPAVTSALIGLRHPAEVVEVVGAANTD